MKEYRKCPALDSTVNCTPQMPSSGLIGHRPAAPFFFFVSPTFGPLLSKLGSPTFGPLLFEAKKKTPKNSVRYF